jgi:hypothetical protein
MLNGIQNKATVSQSVKKCEERLVPRYLGSKREAVALQVDTFPEKSEK